MTLEELDYFLRAPSAQEQQKTGEEAFVPMREGIPAGITTVDGMTGEEELRCLRYPRYMPMEIRRRDWLEVLYLYSGECRLEINGRMVRMVQGESILLDTDAALHVPELGREDILLSFVIPRAYMKEHFLRGLARHSALSHYLLFSLEGGGKHDSFFHFYSQDNYRVKFVFQEWCCEYFEPSPDSEDVIRCLFALGQCELDRCRMEEDENSPISEKACDTSVLPVLNYITRNYQTVTLKTAAKHFHLNPNYLSSVLKAKTGMTFQELLIRQRIQAAQQLLSNSGLPVTEIARQVGYDNTSFFYKKFREITGKSPADLRKK